MSDLVKIADAAAPITSLALHNGVVLATVSSGQLVYLKQAASPSSSPASLPVLLDTHGGPRGLAVDARTGEVYFTDSVRKAVVKLELPATSAGSAGALSMQRLWDSLAPSSSDAAGVAAWASALLRSFVDGFMDAPLRGPHGIGFDAKGEMYVSDPGAFGDTGICGNAHGSVLRTIANCQQVVPLAATGLAYPAGLACNHRTGAVFVCELAANRLLRFVPRVAGASSAGATSAFGSVFCQFAGGMGPIAVAIDATQDLIFVAKFDLAATSSSASGGVVSAAAERKAAELEGPLAAAARVGEVVVLRGSSGETVARITVPGTEITALAVNPATHTLYIAEGRSLFSVVVQL